MAARLALPTLLSQVLVAFTIECDNESEHRIAHSTTRGQASDSRRGPWLVSQAMWANFMQFIDADGVPLSEVEGLAAITNLAGMKRWGYVVVEPDPADDRPEPLRSDLVVRPTRAGRKAQEIWQPLADEIEQRWQGRQAPRVARGTRRPVRHRASSVPPGGLDPYVRRAPAFERESELPHYPMVLHRGGFPDGS